jgi:hypothetical protein
MEHRAPGGSVRATLAVLLCLLAGCPHLGGLAGDASDGISRGDSAHAAPIIRELRSGPGQGLLDGVFSRVSHDEHLPSEQDRPPSQHFLDLVRRAYAPSREVHDATLQRDMESRNERPPKAPRPLKQHRK